MVYRSMSKVEISIIHHKHCPHPYVHSFSNMKNVLTGIIMISQCKTHLVIQRSMDVILLKYKEKVFSLMHDLDISNI